MKDGERPPPPKKNSTALRGKQFGGHICLSVGSGVNLADANQKPLPFFPLYDVFFPSEGSHAFSRDTFPLSPSQLTFSFLDFPLLSLIFFNTEGCDRIST